MKRIVIVILTLLASQSNYGQKIGDKYLLVSAAFSDSTVECSIIDSNWIETTHCLRLVIDTITITSLRTVIYEINQTGDNSYYKIDSNTYFEGIKKYFDKEEGDTLFNTYEGNVKRLFEMNNFNDLNESKISWIMLWVRGVRGTLDPISNYGNECISPVQKQTLRRLLNNKDEELQIEYRRYRLYFESKIMTKSGKEIELNDIILYL